MNKLDRSLKPMRVYKIGKRVAKTYNEWMKYINKELLKSNNK
tara:strand:- start:69 stop:194 length:126 start_codon:yes stop_codon:yes gene_type:complete